MKNCKKHFIVVLIVLAIGQFLAPMTARAQVMEFGGTVGLSYYMGDINPSKPFNQSSLGWGMLARYYEGTRWAFRFAYSNLQLNGSDEKSGYRPERGLSFKTNVHDFALIAEFNFFDYFTGSRRNGLSPYLFGGLSVFYFNPKAHDGKELHDVITDVEYDKDDNEYKVNYSLVNLSIPFGIGVKYSVNKKLGTALEWRWDLTFTDWLDDCHAYYPSDNNEYSDPTGFHTQGDMYVQRGNKYDYDWFGYLNFSLTYKFNLPSGNDCNKRERYKNYD